MSRFLVCLSTVVVGVAATAARGEVKPGSLEEKARYFQQDLLDKHWLDGLYVSIVPVLPEGAKPEHDVDEPGNVIHAGVWTGRYLAGVGYQYAVTRDPWVRQHGGQILGALRILQEVTGKAGLLARGYVKGHGPVSGWERDGADSPEWHQGQGKYAGYRWYGDVSVDNFNAVLYGYAVYFDLAADDEQKEMIAHDVDRLMTHLLDNHCRIVDVDGEVTRFGHVGIDPDPARDAYYDKLHQRRRRFYGVDSVGQMPLRASLMLLPDLLIAHRITGKGRYDELYRRVIARFRDNPEPDFYRRSSASGRRLRANHSSEGQAYEALYNLNRLERDPELLARYRGWVDSLWERNWMEGNSLFTYMTLAMLPEYRVPGEPGQPSAVSRQVAHAEEALRDARETLARFPLDRVMHPVMNSVRTDIEFLAEADRGGRKQAARPLPVDQRPLDNEYEWKGNPYRLDGWLKPTVTAIEMACDDPLVAWFADSSGRAFRTLDGGQSWHSVTTGLMGASVQNLAASKQRTFVLWAQTGGGVFISHDGGLSWRPGADDAPQFPARGSATWVKPSDSLWLRVGADGRLERSTDGGRSTEPAMRGWRIAIARSVFDTPWGVVASGPGGTYRTTDGRDWREMKLWPESETGAADFLHAYWMGRYYGFVPPDAAAK